MRANNEMIKARIETINRLMETTSADAFEMGAAYGGYRLERIAGTGIKSLTPYTTKKELVAYMDAFIDGILAIKNK